MTRTWPSFVTRDLGDSPEDSNEMLRRWETYNADMQALIAAGGVHQDGDGWWVDDASSELIGPDPEIERPQTDAELARMRSIAEAMPEFHAAVTASIRKRGSARTKTPVTIRLDDAVVSALRATGPGWQTRVNDVLKDWLAKAG